MTQSNTIIRELKEDDDLVIISNLINGTRQLYSHNQKFKLYSAPFLKQWIFPERNDQAPQVQVKAFVLEEQGEITGVMAVEIREKSGMLEYGIKQGSSEQLAGLVERCSKVIEERNGNQLYIFAHTQFGQISNREILAFEQLGFRSSDPYIRVSTRLRMDNWQAPEQLDTERIQVENRLQQNDIYNILLADKAGTDAVIFNYQFSARFQPNSVLLTMRNDNDEVTAIAYYKVRKLSGDQDLFAASAFNLHFRPDFKLSREQQRGFLQGVLTTMKQLDIQVVNSLMSLKNVDNFTLMVREGFDEITANFFSLSKKLEPLIDEKV
jgi:hypothetical protein